MAENAEKTTIREWNEGIDVEVKTKSVNDDPWAPDCESNPPKDRLVLVAYNEAGCNCVYVDLLDVIDFVKKEMPELLS